MSCVLILGTGICFWGTPLFAKPSVPVKVGNPLSLTVEDGKVKGTFSDRPLGEILNRLSQLGKFKVRVNENLTRYPVSGQFDKVSLPEALKQILGPFNYLILAGTEAKPGTIFILDLRSGDPSAGPSPLQEATAPNSQEGPRFLTPDDVELPDELREAFEVAGKKQGPPPELRDLFYPEQDPGSEETGPPGPEISPSLEQFGEPLPLGEVEMTDEQRAAFGIADQKQGPPPELMDQFYPEQSPESFQTGPTSP